MTGIPRRAGFDAIATGHHASIVLTPAGPRLGRAIDAAKDQSYVLGVLTSKELERVIFPIGASADKASVRAEADARGAVVLWADADAPDAIGPVKLAAMAPMDGTPLVREVRSMRAELFAN